MVLDNERRLSALSELWLSFAIQADQADGPKTVGDVPLDAYLQSARCAYAYLFYTARNPASARSKRGSRRCWIFTILPHSAPSPICSTDCLHWAPIGAVVPVAGWSLLRPISDVNLGSSDPIPKELLAAEGLRFKGLRNIYRRDGFGSEFVAVGAPLNDQDQLWRESTYVPLTAVLEFPGDTLESVLATHDVQLYARSPVCRQHHRGRQAKPFAGGQLHCTLRRLAGAVRVSHKSRSVRCSDAAV